MAPFISNFILSANLTHPCSQGEILLFHRVLSHPQRLREGDWSASLRTCLPISDRSCHVLLTISSPYEDGENKGKASRLLEWSSNYSTSSTYVFHILFHIEEIVFLKQEKSLPFWSPLAHRMKPNSWERPSQFSHSLSFELPFLALSSSSPQPYSHGRPILSFLNTARVFLYITVLLKVLSLTRILLLRFHLNFISSNFSRQLFTSCHVLPSGMNTLLQV